MSEASHHDVGERVVGRGSPAPGANPPHGSAPCPPRVLRPAHDAPAQTMWRHCGGVPLPKALDRLKSLAEQP